MQISKRLEAVAHMVTPGCIIADIGTDHAYIPIYLVSGGKAPRALAMDVNRGPLEKAVIHIRQYGLGDRIETRLSDGLSAMQPGEAQSIIIAGMGGPLTIRILKEGVLCAQAAQELILQPQSEIRLVRAYLEENGYRIVQENIVCEEGKFYPMMKAVKAPEAATLQEDAADKISAVESRTAKAMYTAEEKCEAPAVGMSDAELRYGPLLLSERHPVLKDYLLREQDLNRRILAALEGQETDQSLKRRGEVELELKIIGEVLALYD